MGVWEGSIEEWMWEDLRVFFCFVFIIDFLGIRRRRVLGIVVRS